MKDAETGWQEGKTLSTSTPHERSSSSAAPVPALTILARTDSTRVGERLALPPTSDQDLECSTRQTNRRGMQMAKKEMAPTKALGVKVTHVALSVLKENAGEMPMREIIDAVGDRVELDDWARERYEKTGYVRWESVLHFYSIDCVKAGFLVKKKGVWYLTPEGEEALKLGPVGLLESARKAYRISTSA